MANLLQILKFSFATVQVTFNMKLLNTVNTLMDNYYTSNTELYSHSAVFILITLSVMSLCIPMCP